jgi:hypothetical protein
MFNVLTGLAPFEITNPHAHAQRVVNGVRPNIPDTIVPDFIGAVLISLYGKQQQVSHQEFDGV